MVRHVKSEVVALSKYIDSKAAYELARTNEYYSDFRRSTADLTSLKELLDDTPAYDVVEVVHGEWLEVQYTYFGAKRYECSQCRDDEFWKKRYI